MSTRSFSALHHMSTEIMDELDLWILGAEIQGFHNGIWIGKERGISVFQAMDNMFHIMTCTDVKHFCSLHTHGEPATAVIKDTVTWAVTLMHNSACLMNVRHFPDYVN